jgi:hypothetical protein
VATNALRAVGLAGLSSVPRGFGGNLRVVHAFAHKPELAIEHVQLANTYDGQGAGKKRGETDIYEGPPILRRFLLAFLSLLLGGGLGFWAASNIYNQRILIGSLLACAGLLLAWSGLGLLIMTAYPATWGWWL